MLPQDTGCGILSPVCDVVGGIVGGAGSAAADAVLGSIGGAFVAAAQQVADIAFAALDATTSINLTAAWFTKNVGVLAAIALPIVVGLFSLQVIGSVLRREPGGLGRALVGVGKATIGASLAIATTQLALLATDEICRYIAASAGTSVRGAAQRFLVVSWLSGGAGPILQMLLGLAIIVGSLLLWAVLLFRKAAVLLVAVFAPVAFAGAVWDQTQSWTRKWIEAMTALVLCKIVIVVVFVLGLSAFANDGTTSTGSQSTAGSLSDVLVGMMLLSIAVFAPWLTWRFVHWSGIEAGTSLHGAVASSPIPGAVRSTAAQTRFMVQSAATSAALGGASGSRAHRVPPVAHAAASGSRSSAGESGDSR
ncbi:MAG: hypothetical protein JWO62_1159 [Acidimicrobiaceae bacterium]|nr:hypothetical protein [Acidimicrobiaceae bacterium]